MYYTLMFTKTKQMQKELSIILALDFSSYISKDSKTETMRLLRTIYSLPAQLLPQKEESDQR